MSPSLHSEIVLLDEVPLEILIDDTELRRPIVLVVDDEPLVADTLSTIFARAGFSMLTAYDGPAALELVREIRPELLISDVAMPEMNGVELALEVIKVVPTCKILLFSGHATSADLIPALDAGHDFPLLAKPVHPIEMLRLVNKSLNMPEKETRVGWCPVVPIHQNAS